VSLLTEEDDVLLATRNGKAIRFCATDVREFQSRTSAGVRGATAATVTHAGSAEQGVFRRLISLGRGRGVEEPHALEDVLKS